MAEIESKCCCLSQFAEY